MNKETIIQGLVAGDRLGRSSFGFFIKSANSKPPLQELINNIENMSTEDIDALQQRPWIKKHLRKLHKEITIRPEGALSPDEIAAMMVAKSSK